MSNNTQELINSFKSLLYEMQKSPFIMSNKVIVKILKLVASNEELKFVVDHANQLYNFSEIFDEAIVNGGFVMPAEDYKIIVLVTGVLFNIDRGNIDYLSFIKTYFPNNGVAESFNDFCDIVVCPYVFAFENILSNDNKIVNIETAMQAKPLSRQLVDQLNEYIISLTEQIAFDKSIPDSKKDELFGILEGFNIAIENGNTIMIKAIWLGLKYALLFTKSFTSYIKLFEAELKNYDIIS